MNCATFRFYGELNDLLPRDIRQTDYEYSFRGRPAVKDAIEAMGVPHTEVDVIIANGTSVAFNHRLNGGDRVAVFPVFESLDVSTITRLRPRPLRRSRFVLDVHLGTLARMLRRLGFDTAYRSDCDDRQIIDTAISEHRIILTRDRGILKDGRVTHGYCVRSTVPGEQIRDVLRRFDLLGEIRPFSRCIKCNALLVEVNRADVAGQVPARVRDRFDAFFRCERCHNVYWHGSHVDRMRLWLEQLMVEET